MNEASNHTAFFRGLRQMFGVTLILLLLCGFVFPVLLTGISLGGVPSAGRWQSGLCGRSGRWIKIRRTGVYQTIFL